MDVEKILYTSTLRLMKAKSKLISKVRFQKDTHIALTRRLIKDLKKMLASPDLVKNYKPRLKKKIHTEKGDKKVLDLMQMIKSESLIIPLTKSIKVSRLVLDKKRMSKNVYYIVQTMIEDIVYDYTIKLVNLVLAKGKKTIKRIDMNLV